MITVKIYQTELGQEPYTDYVTGMKDKIAKSRMIKAVERMELGLFGEAKSLQDGLQELKIRVGEGHRIYYYLDGQTLVVLLSASNKKDQKREIKRAKNCLIDYKRRKDTEDERSDTS